MDVEGINCDLGRVRALCLDHQHAMVLYPEVETQVAPRVHDPELVSLPWNTTTATEHTSNEKHILNSSSKQLNRPVGIQRASPFDTLNVAGSSVDPYGSFPFINTASGTENLLEFNLINYDRWIA